MAAEQDLRVGQVVRSRDGFVGAVVQPEGLERAAEPMRTRGAPLQVYTVYRAATGEVRRFARESLKPLTDD